MSELSNNWCIAVAQHDSKAKTVDVVDETVETFYKCALYKDFELAKEALLTILMGHGAAIDAVDAPDEMVAEHAELTVGLLGIEESDFADRKIMSVTSCGLFAYGISKDGLPKSEGGRFFELVADHRECTADHCQGIISKKN